MRHDPCGWGDRESDLMETTSTIQNSSITPYRANSLYEILVRTMLAIGAILTIVWIAFLGYGLVRLFELAV